MEVQVVSCLRPHSLRLLTTTCYDLFSVTIHIKDSKCYSKKEEGLETDTKKRDLI